MKEHDIHRLSEKYVKGTCTPQEKQLVEDFLQSYQKEQNWLNWKHGDEVKIGNNIYAKIKSNISAGEKKKKSKERSLWTPVLKYAAAIILLVASVFVINHYTDQQPEINTITKQTQRGQKSNIVLSDGTTIRLNSESSLTFPEKFDGDTREVILTGEAFFEVTRNTKKPFIVRSGNLTTTVLGTSFNIMAFKNESIQVTVATGKVRVALSPSGGGEGEVSFPGEGGRQATAESDGRGKTQFLTPNEQATYNLTTGTLNKKTVNTNNYTAWKDGIIYFNEIPLSEAIAILERWYGVTITLANQEMKGCIIVGEHKNENLRNVLQNLQYAIGIKYEFTENGVIINGKGC